MFLTENADTSRCFISVKGGLPDKQRDSLNNEVVADRFVPLHSAQFLWYWVALCTDGWWNPSSVCKVHPCFLSQTFYLEVLFGKLPETLPSCAKYIFPIYLIWPFYKKRASTVPSYLAQKLQHRMKQVLGSWPKIYKNFIWNASILLFYTVIINIWSLHIMTRSKLPNL